MSSNFVDALCFDTVDAVVAFGAVVLDDDGGFLDSFDFVVSIFAEFSIVVGDSAVVDGVAAVDGDSAVVGGVVMVVTVVADIFAVEGFEDQQLRWPSGESLRLGSCRLGFNSESGQTSDF